jgi:hypothetical protein
MLEFRRTLIVLMGLAVSACATATGGSPPGTPMPRAERPSLSLGDKWIRYDGSYELVRIENDRYVFAAGPSAEIHLTRNLGFAKIQRGGYLMEFNPPLDLPWPLQVGRLGSIEGTWRTPQIPQGFPARFAWSVDAYEDVDVVAGTFKAFKISFEIRAAGPSAAYQRWRNDIVLWYAPEVKQFVKAQSANVGMVNFQILLIDRPATAPLEVALQGPKDQAKVASEGVSVVGKVTSGKGVTRVSITLNGEEIVKRDESQAPAKEMTFDLPVKLREGKNVILVTAVDPDGATRQEARTLFYDKPASPPPVVAKPTPPSPAAPPAPPAVPPPAVAKPVPPPTPAAPAPPTAPPAVAARSPLQLTLSSPRDQARVEHESIGLAGLVSGGKGVSRVVVSLNGVEVSRQEEGTPQPAMAVNLPIKLREGQNTLVVNATEAGGTIYQEVRTVHYEKLVPLSIAFRYPEDRSRITEEASVVAAVLTSSKGVSKVRVTLNGVEIHEQTERTPQKSVVVTAPATFKEGANAIVLTASEPDGTVRQEVRTVIYERPQVAVAAPPPPPPPAPTHDRWAVVIGVGRYESPDIPKLRYTVPDADAVYEVLTGPGGFKKEHVLLLTDKTDKKPTYRNLKWALGTFLARSAKKDDTVLIYFAGHGAPEVDQRGIERDGFSKYLVPTDAEPDDLYSTALPMDELTTIFGRIEAERVVVFLDSCYSGAAGGRTFASKKTRAGHVDEEFLERLARSKGRAIVTASRATEVSIELPELGHGIFTYYLVQGLKGMADLNRDGIVTLQELYEYIEQEVSKKSRAVGGNQHPVMKGELEGVLPLVRVK